ncbi:24994_t:CDS:2, partial [Dentiscutata erythropus]
ILEKNDPRRIAYFTNGEGKGTLESCQVCKEENPRHNMYNISPDHWFCKLEHMYAWKSAGSQYNLNKNKILMVALNYVTVQQLIVKE